MMPLRRWVMPKTGPETCLNVVEDLPQARPYPHAVAALSLQTLTTEWLT